MKILIVEDDRRTAAYLRKGFSEHGFVADVAHTGEDGLHAIRAGAFDLIILDIMLPARDGWAVLEQMRSLGDHTPVICVTARDAVADRVKGLNLGADDYLVKPFAFSELLARARSVLRRPPARIAPRISIGGLEMDLIRRLATRDGVALSLTPKEFALLSFMAERKGEVLSRTFIAERVWDMNFDPGSNVVDVHIRRLRAKVDDPFPTKLIRTVRGAGYVLEPPS